MEILWGFMNFNFKLNLKVSAFYLEKQRNFIPEKKFFSPMSISKQKSFVYWPNFQWRFCMAPTIFLCISLSSKAWKFTTSLRPLIEHSTVNHTYSKWFYFIWLQNTKSKLSKTNIQVNVRFLFVTQILTET